jgi:hypothetical protein
MSNSMRKCSCCHLRRRRLPWRWSRAVEEEHALAIEGELQKRERELVVEEEELQKRERCTP